MPEPLPPAADALAIAGYTDPMSVEPGQALQVMVSAAVPYRAEVVRLISAETARDGTGFREAVVEAIPTVQRPGRKQAYRLGSWGEVSPHPALARDRDLTIAAFVLPTTPDRGRQTVIATDRWRLAIDPTAGLVLAVEAEEAWTGVPLAAERWSFIAASLAADGSLLLVQWPTPAWPVEPRRVMAHTRLGGAGAPAERSSLTFAARMGPDGARTEHFNGRIASPTLIEGALDEDDLRRLSAGELHLGSVGAAVVAAWDFAREIPTDGLVDTGPNSLHGRTRNLPTRAVTDHTWRGHHHDWTTPGATGYGAIHFHDDDLDDAGWEADLEVALPPDLPSGIYAVRLTSSDPAVPAEDHVPFFVRAPRGRPAHPLLFLQSTNTHLAYANWHVLMSDQRAALHGYPTPYPLQPEQRYAIGNSLLSLYDEHADGSGVCYSSRLRPIVNMRPKMNDQPGADGIGYAHGLKADLQLAGWLESNGLGFDVATDEDLHRDGLERLAPYRVVLTGTHPEYWTEAMLDAAEAYLAQGGRFVYLGGNGFYWITSFDPGRPHVIEVRRSNGSRAWSARPGEYRHSTTGEVGGLWRERGRAPQRLAGVGFTGQGAGRGQPYRRTAAAADPRAAWIFAGVPDEVFGDEGLVVDGSAGFEIDRADVALGTPPHALVVATATGFSDYYQHAIEEVAMSDSRQGGTVEPRVRADLTFFETPNGGAVFSVGSIAYAGALFVRRPDGSEGPISRITRNVLTRFLDARPFPE